MSILVVGGAYDDTGTSFFVSTDAGVTWTPSSDNGPFAGYSVVEAVAEGGGVLVAVGRKSFVAGSQAAIATSEDGFVWTEATFPVVTNGELRAVHWNGVRWVAVGEQEVAGEQSPWMITSLDGVTWVDVTTYPAIGIHTTAQAVTYGDGLWVAGFSVSTEGDPLVATSVDGLNWIASTLTGSDVSDIAVIDGTIITLGWGWETGIRVNASTNGGATWSVVTQPFDVALYRIRTDGSGRWVLLGRKLHPPGAVYWYYAVAYSDDQGANWTLVDTGFDHEAVWSELWWDTSNEKWMMLGYGQDDNTWPPTGVKGRVIYSPDLVNWALVGTFWSITEDPVANTVTDLDGCSQPPNDNWADAEILVGDPSFDSPGTVLGSTVCASVEVGETATSSHTVWYSWTPGASGDARISLGQAFGFGSLEWRVWVGDALADLTLVVGDTAPAGLQWSAVAGETYYLQIDMDPATDGDPYMPPEYPSANFVFQWSLESFDPCPEDTVWYAYTPTQSGEASFFIEASLWTWCPAIDSWVGRIGPVPDGWTWPVAGSNDPDLSDLLAPLGAFGEIDLFSRHADFTRCDWEYNSERWAAYLYEFGEPQWENGAPGSPDYDTLFVVASGPNYDSTDPPPAWDPISALTGVAVGTGRRRMHMEVYTGDELSSLSGPMASYSGDDPLFPLTFEVEGFETYWIRVYNDVYGEFAAVFNLSWDLVPTLTPRTLRQGTGRLGCGELAAFITAQCGAPRLCQLTDASSIKWNRRLDEISDASVVVPTGGSNESECCECLAEIEPWCHELHIFRNGVFVWGGPVTKVTYGYDEVTIDARDVLAWTEFRISELTLDYSVVSADIADIAETILAVAFAEHDPCVLDHIQKRPTEFPAINLLAMPCYEQTAYEQLTDIADGLLDFTVLGRSIILGGENLPDKAIGVLTDEMILGEIEVTKNGMLAGNRYFTRFEGDDVPAECFPVDITCPGCQCKCPAISEVTEGPCTCVDAGGDDHCFSPLERLLDVGQPANHDTAKQFGDAALASSRISPRTIEFNEGTRISPEAPWDINDMVPGQRIDVTLTGLCLPVFQSFRLVEMGSSQDGLGEEEVTVSLQLVVPAADQ